MGVGFEESANNAGEEWQPPNKMGDEALFLESKAERTVAMLKFACSPICALILFLAPVDAEEKHLANASKTPSMESRDDGFPMPKGALMRFGNRYLRHPGGFISGVLSPDGRYLATQDSDKIIIWDLLASQAKRILLDGNDNKRRVENDCTCFGSDSKVLIYVVRRFDPDNGQESYLRGVNIETGQQTFSTTMKDKSFNAAWLMKDGKEIACSDSECIYFFDVVSGKAVRKEKLVRTARSENSPLISRNGRIMVCRNVGESIVFVDTQTGNQIYQHPWKNIFLIRSALSPDGKWFCYIQGDALKLLDVDNRIEKYSIDLPGDNHCKILVANDNKTLYLIDQSGIIYSLAIDKIDSGFKTVCKFSRFFDHVDECFLGHDCRSIYLIDSLDRICKIDLDSKKEQILSEGYQDPYPYFQLSANEEKIVITDARGRIDFWAFQKGSLIESCRLSEMESACRMSMTSNGRWFAMGDRIDRLQVLDTTSQKLDSRRLQKHDYFTRESSLEQIILDEESKSVVCVANDQIVVRDIATQRERWSSETTHESLAVFPGIRNGCFYYSKADKTDFPEIEPDGLIVVQEVLSGKIRAQFRDIPSERNIPRKRREDPKSIKNLCPSFDGTSLFTVDRYNEIRLWDMETGSLIRRIEMDDESNCIAVSPSEKWVAVGLGRHIYLFELGSGKIVHQLEGHGTGIGQISFMRDSPRLLSSGDHSVTLWTLKPDKLATFPSLDGKLWDKFASDEAAEVYRLQWAMLERPKESIEWLAKHVKRNDSLTKNDFDKLVADLDQNRFAVREKAQASLIAKNHQIPLAWLKKVPPGSEEVRSRIEQVCKTRTPGPVDRESLRLNRAIHLLELIDSTESRALLKSLAGQTPETQFTYEAKVSLERLNYHTAKSVKKRMP